MLSPCLQRRHLLQDRRRRQRPASRPIRLQIESHPPGRSYLIFMFLHPRVPLIVSKVRLNSACTTRTRVDLGRLRPPETRDVRHLPMLHTQQLPRLRRTEKRLQSSVPRLLYRLLVTILLSLNPLRPSTRVLVESQRAIKLHRTALHGGGLVPLPSSMNARIESPSC